MDTIPRQLLLQVFLILFNAFFAATEIAVISLNPVKLRKLAEDGDKTAPKLLKLVEAPANFLSTIQVGITFAGFLGSAFAADNFSGYITDWIYNTLGFKALSESTLDTISVIIITIILSYFTLVLGELVPKRIAMQKSMEVAKISCRVIPAVSVFVRPLVWLLSISTNAVLKLLRINPDAKDEAVTEDEIRMMVDIGEEKGTIESETKEWIDNVFDFGDTTAADIMTNQPDIVFISEDSTKEEILEIINKNGYSRYPVIGEDINDILGILYTRDFLLSLNGDMLPIRKLLRPAYFIPEVVHADMLFRNMQSKKQHIAIVADEYGSVSGLVTMEDLLEELVGNIYDEFDEEEPPDIIAHDDGSFMILGGTNITEAADAIGMEIPEDCDYETFGGYILSNLESIPENGSTFNIQADDFDITVLNIENRRIDKVIVKKIEKSSENEDENKSGENENSVNNKNDKKANE